MNSALAATTAGATGDPIRSQKEGFVLGIDVGGTKLALGTADLDGNRLFDNELPTLADQGAPAVISRLLEAARGLINEDKGGRRRRAGRRRRGESGYRAGRPRAARA